MHVDIIHIPAYPNQFLLTNIPNDIITIEIFIGKMFYSLLCNIARTDQSKKPFTHVFYCPLFMQMPGTKKSVDHYSAFTVPRKMFLS